MKITIELPDSTLAANISYVSDNGNQLVLVTKSIGTNDLRERYKDCTDYEVSE